MVRLSTSSTYTNTRRASIDPKQLAISGTLCDMCLSVKGKSLFRGIYIHACTLLGLNNGSSPANQTQYEQKKLMVKFPGWRLVVHQLRLISM